MKVINYLLGYKNLYIVQDTNMFNFSLDSVLLSNFVTINKEVKRIMDIGCGNAPIPIILSTKTDSKIIGVEIQEEVYNLAVESIKINSLDKQIEVINSDINDIYKNYEVGSFDLITCNPPFFKYTNNSNVNKTNYETLARHEVTLNLEQIMKIAKYLLKNNGKIDIVHRPERFVDIIESMRTNNIEPKKVQLIYPHDDSEANMILVEGIKNAKCGLKVLKPIISHNRNGQYTEEVKKFFINN